MLRASDKIKFIFRVGKLVLCGLVLLLGPLSVFADGSVTLTWSPSADPNAVGYNIYYGGSSGDYTNTIAAGSATTATISGLTEGATYYFAATTVDASGAESPFSNEAVYFIPLSATNSAPTNTPDASLPPTLDPIANATLFQNAGTQTINLTGITAGSNAGATLNVSAVAGDPTIVSALNIIYTSPNNTGTLTFTPGANLGTATVTVTVDNGAASNNVVTQTFTVTVSAPPAQVSQSPTLDPLTNVVVFQNSGTQTVNLTGIGSTLPNPGIKIWAYVSDSTIISQPTVNYDSPASTGTVTFAPLTNALGTTTVEVKVNDGNANFSQFFTVTVVSPPPAAAPAAPAPVPPTLDSIPNLNLYQNAGTQAIALTGISPGTSGTSSVNIQATSSDTTVIATPTVIYTNANSTGVLLVSPVANALGTATITVTVDNGGASNNITTQTFTVTVAAAPVNSITTPPQPTLDAITNFTVYQNSGNQTVALTGIASGATSGNLTLTVWAYSSDTTIVSTPQVNYTNPNSSGTLTFAAATNGLGTATITVKVNNGLANFIQTFNVTVLPTPPSPRAYPIPNLNLLEGTLSQVVPISGISPGAGSTLRITATSSNPRLIPTPWVSYIATNTTASLTLRPMPGATGSATIIVTLNNGAKSNNISTQTFNVTVSPPPPPTLDPIANVTVAQNAGLQVLTLTGISAGSTGLNQKIRVSAATSNPRAFPSPTINYTSPDSTATLSFSPSQRFTGTVMITVTVSDANRYNNVVRQKFAITVTPPPKVIASFTSTTSTTNVTASLTSVTKSNGQFGFQVIGVTGATYVVQATSDLTHWTSLQTNVAPFEFSEPMSADAGPRFYRATYLH
jgi:hypothetical protein